MDNDKEQKIEFWKEYWPLLQQTTKETEEHIDKKVYGIAAGGIGIEIASVQFLDIIRDKWLALVAGLLFTTTLVLNLLSHVRSLKSQKKEGDEIQRFIEDENTTDDSTIYDKIEKENQCLMRINIASICTMVAAIISLLLFIVLNV